jgi:hypothetical protein
MFIPLIAAVAMVDYDMFTNLLGQPRGSRAGATNATFVPLTDTTALCLDGSQYGYFWCPGSEGTKNWTISLQGGGWCYDEPGCAERAKTRLGSSKSWPTCQGGGIPGSPLICPACNAGKGPAHAAYLYYCDGASFSGYREDPWPVPGAGTSLMFRGSRNLDATIDHLLANHGLSEAQNVVVTGGSAGGLSTFLHLDHVAGRLPHATVRGMPVCGFFLDHGNDGFAPTNTTYPRRMEYVYNMQNASGFLSSECQTAYGKDAWKCIMAPHAAWHVKTPWFALQSRFDQWQLGDELFLPCMRHQSFRPPFRHPSNCTQAEIDAIKSCAPCRSRTPQPCAVSSVSCASVCL